MPVRFVVVTEVQIRPTRFGAPLAQRMVAAAQEELTQRYGSGDANPIEAIQFDPPEGVFLVAFIDGEPVGCGGWRTISHFVEPAERSVVDGVEPAERSVVDGVEPAERSVVDGVEPAERSVVDGVERPATPEDVAEIKRMYVHPAARNTGVATALLRALEASARESGMRRMILETGRAQPEAISLYLKMGYEKIPNYGHYKDEPDCVSFGRDL